MLLELASEVLGIVETETFGSLRDCRSAHQELLGTLHDETATYPDINWKEGRLLNGSSKEDLKKWVENNK